MDLYTFIAQLVGALAWPVTVIIIILILRRPLVELIPLLQRLRFQGLELDFGKEVHALAEEIRNQLPPSQGILNMDETLREKWIELARVSPRAVVLEAWLQLEQAAIDALKRHDINLKSVEMHSPLILGQALEQAGILAGTMPAVYHQLRNLRNAAAHASAFAFSPDSAIEYADLAARLIAYLRTA